MSASQNFLHLILEGCAISEKEELTTLVSKLHEEMSNLKFCVKEVIEDTYVNFIKMAQEHRQLLFKAQQLKGQIGDLSNKVKNHITPTLKETSRELQQLSDSLQEIRIMHTYVDHLLELNSLFQSVSKLSDRKEYQEMAKAFTRIRDILEEPTDRENNMTIYQALADEYTNQCASFINDMQDLWGECIRFESKLLENSACVRVCSLWVDISRSQDIAQVLLALNYMEPMMLHFKRFSDKILESLLMPVIKLGARTSAEENEKSACLIVEIMNPDESHSKNVCINLLEVFHFIHSHLRFNVDDNTTLLNKIGSAIGAEFYDLLLEHCSQIDDVTTILADLTDLQIHMTEQGFFNKEDPKLLDFINSVEYLSTINTTRTLLRTARDIMKSDLCDAVEVGGESDRLDEDMKTENVSSLKLSINLRQSSTQIPKCRISKSTLELLDLISQVLLHCSASSGANAVKSFCMARDVLELYCAIVPVHHGQFLQHFPQHVALFHNNCMYLAQCMMTVGDMHRSLLPDILQTHLVTFLDQITELRLLGTNVFLKYMQTQRNQILDIIKNCGLEALGTSSDVTGGREEGMRQCLKQLEMLQSTWQPILQDDVYYKAMGSQVNAFLDKLITCVVTADDISADTSMELVELFKNVAAKVLCIFQEANDIHQYVKRWEVFAELTAILGGSLRDLGDRWNGGRGPMARLFKPAQIKNLVTALFQNTEQRSEFLARIK